MSVPPSWSELATVKQSSELESRAATQSLELSPSDTSLPDSPSELAALTESTSEPEYSDSSLSEPLISPDSAPGWAHERPSSGTTSGASRMTWISNGCASMSPPTFASRFSMASLTNSAMLSLQSGQRSATVSHLSTQPRWKTWPQRARPRTTSPYRMSSMQIMHGSMSGASSGLSCTFSVGSIRSLGQQNSKSSSVYVSFFFAFAGFGARTPVDAWTSRSSTDPG
mmetsp:Transcript_27181/g.68154  ORF Transcript_27181/g.68154 Transcript_27181/m.68154 type:complete len:226 (+) Transcript_27181:170-847(+)